MKSGAYFSAIFVIWIIAGIFAVYLLLPDIENSIKSVNNIDIQSTAAVLSDSQETEDITAQNAISYTPLGIFELLRN